MSPGIWNKPSFYRPVPDTIQPLRTRFKTIEYPDYSEQFDVFEDRLGGFQRTWIMKEITLQVRLSFKS